MQTLEEQSCELQAVLELEKELKQKSPNVELGERADQGEVQCRGLVMRESNAPATSEKLAEAKAWEASAKER